MKIPRLSRRGIRTTYFYVRRYGCLLEITGNFREADGNSWFVQEITNRLPGRAISALAVYGSVAGLAAALRRAEAAHGKHEQQLGHRDENWPDWYARYMVEETRQDKAA